MATLIFTIAQNGYGHAFRPCVTSQRRYAARLGVNYVAIEKPRLVPEPAISAWLKVPTMLHALESGYDEVAYIDADCEVSADAPDFRDLVRDAKSSVQMAEGLSGRLNSGVMFARRESSSIEFFRSVLESVTQEITDEDRANLKFENGNIIYIDRTRGGVGRLSPVWNNTFDPELDDHIRHFTGPLRALYKRSNWDTLMWKIGRRGAAKPTRQPARRDHEFLRTLEVERRKTVQAYPKLTAHGA